jgi:hypothetical protein
MTDGHPDGDGIEDQYNNPEFYRKLRQGGALEKSWASIGAARAPEGPAQLSQSLQPR